jgi:hypothetical protein
MVQQLLQQFRDQRRHPPPLPHGPVIGLAQVVVTGVSPPLFHSNCSELLVVNEHVPPRRIPIRRGDERKREVFVPPNKEARDEKAPQVGK